MNDKMHEVMAGHVERGELPGLVMLVAERGDVKVDVIGKQSVDGAPMRRDTLFRISSMTKPITAAAAMILVEEGKLRLDDPVDRWLPELANRRVLSRIDGPLDDTVPAERAITLRDLLAFRMGFGLVWGPQDALPIQRAAHALGLGAFGPPRNDAPAPDEWMRRFATLPLMHQPGARWSYNTSYEVLGVLIARASGRTFETFLRERIFEPLAMKDTGFSTAKRDRLATSYFANGEKLDLYDPVDGNWSRPPAFQSGGAGLVSTIDDYFAFANMLLGGRLLSPQSVAAMTTDHITPAQKALSGSGLSPGWWKNHGWGFGVAIVTGEGSPGPAVGAYGWDGGLGTSWWTEPKRERIGILMTQRSEFPLFSAVYRDFWTALR